MTTPLQLDGNTLTLSDIREVAAKKRAVEISAASLARVAKDRIRERAAYEFFVRRDDDGKSVWSRRVEERGHVFAYPKHCERLDVAYNPGIKRYLMTVGYGHGKGWASSTRPSTRRTPVPRAPRASAVKASVAKASAVPTRRPKADPSALNDGPVFSGRRDVAVSQ